VEECEEEEGEDEGEEENKNCSGCYPTAAII
jgi:hypothetical protein